jgi:hypothetical protein
VLKGMTGFWYYHARLCVSANKVRKNRISLIKKGDMNIVPLDFTPLDDV